MKKVIAILIIFTYNLISISFALPSYAAGDPYPVWKPVKRTKAFEEKGRWCEAARAYTNGKSSDWLGCNFSKSMSSTFNGELKISFSELESYALMQHKINKSFKTEVIYRASLKGRKKGTYAICYRRVYRCRWVTQKKYLHVDGYLAPTSTKKKVKSKDFKCVAYKLKKISNRDVT